MVTKRLNQECGSAPSLTDMEFLRHRFEKTPGESAVGRTLFSLYIKDNIEDFK